MQRHHRESVSKLTPVATRGARRRRRHADPGRTVRRRPGISLCSPCTRIASGDMGSGAPTPFRTAVAGRSSQDVVI
jgi:hypothetical protein